MFAAWKRGFQDVCRELPPDAYWPWVTARIERTLARSTVLVAFDDKDVALGWLCYERLADDLAVHWCYSRGWAKRMGVASALIAEAVRAHGDGATRLVHTHRCHPRLTAKVAELGFVYVPLDKWHASREVA